MENEYRSIKLYEEEIVTLLSLPDRSQGRILKAILSECIGRELPQLSALEQAVFMLVNNQIKRAEELSNKRRQSANSRWRDTKADKDDTNDIQKNTDDMQNDTSGIQTSCKDDANSYTNTNTNTITNTITNTPSSAAADAAEGVVPEKASGNDQASGYKASFERFWSGYPKKTAKQSALKAWLKLKPDEKLTENILSALERFKKTDQWLKDNGQYIPYPATWLGGRRWEDECAPPPNNADNRNCAENADKRSSSFTTEDLMDIIRAQCG